MRCLADLAFMLGQYEFAVANYRLAAQDYLAAPNSKWYAGAEVRAAVPGTAGSSTAACRAVSHTHAVFSARLACSSMVSVVKQAQALRPEPGSVTSLRSVFEMFGVPACWCLRISFTCASAGCRR
jgi:hypothetical protein